MRVLILILVILTFLLSTTNAVGQYVNSESIHHKTVKKVAFDLNYKNLIGTVYINANFEIAHISIPNKNYPTRYDAFHDEMEINEKDQQYYLPKTFNYIVTFKESNKTYGVYKLDNLNGFFQILVNENTLHLLMKEKTRMYQEVEGNGITTYKPPTLKRLKDQLYVGNARHETYKLPKKKNDFYAVFSTSAKLVQKFVKENNLNIKKTEDLIQIFNYYNSL